MENTTKLLDLVKSLNNDEKNNLIISLFNEIENMRDEMYKWNVRIGDISDIIGSYEPDYMEYKEYNFIEKVSEILERQKYEEQAEQGTKDYIDNDR